MKPFLHGGGCGDACCLRVQNLSVTIYSMTKKPVTPEINALSTLMFGTVLLLLVIVNIRQVRDLDKQKERR